MQPKMTYADLFALPADEIVPWYDGRGDLLEDAFGVRDGELDTDAAEAANDRRVLVHRKMSLAWESDYSASVYVLTFDDKPYGVYLAAGEDERGHTNFLITDPDTHEEAIRHVRMWRYDRKVGTVIDGDFDISRLGFLGGHAAIVKDMSGTFRLAEEKYVAEDGTLLLDDRAFSDVLHDLRQRILAEDPTADERKGEFLDRLPEAATAIARAIPDGVRYVEVNRWQEEISGTLPSFWRAGVVGTEEGTYEIGVNADALEVSSLRWEWGLEIQRIGGPELFDKFAARYGKGAEAPTP